MKQLFSFICISCVQGDHKVIVSACNCVLTFWRRVMVDMLVFIQYRSQSKGKLLWPFCFVKLCFQVIWFWIWILSWQSWLRLLSPDMMLHLSPTQFPCTLPSKVSHWKYNKAKFSLRCFYYTTVHDVWSLVIILIKGWWSVELWFTMMGSRCEVIKR